MGTVFVENLRQRVIIGINAKERAYPQIVRIDLELDVDTADASSSDNLRDTVDYLKVVEIIESMCRELSWKLIEKMSYDISKELLISFERLNAVSIKIRKNVVPAADAVAVRLTVTRDDI